jgi:hypothetical protein
MKTFELKNDKYRKKRGGYSRFVKIFCGNCKKYLLLYQKDGTGPIKRLYIDRIIEPSNIKNGKIMKCSGCNTIIGTFYVYPKEIRPAFRIYQEAIIKKIIKI